MRTIILSCIFLIIVSDVFACGFSEKIPIGRDMHGNLFAVLSLPNNNTQATNVFALVKPFGERWSTLTEISGTKEKCMGPTIDVLENGNTVALWLVTMESGSNGLMVATLDAISATWAKAILITDSDENVVNNWYNIAITGDGVIAIWSSYIENKETGELDRVMRTASAPFGGTWSAPETIT